MDGCLDCSASVTLVQVILNIVNYSYTLLFGKTLFLHCTESLHLTSAPDTPSALFTNACCSYLVQMESTAGMLTLYENAWVVEPTEQHLKNIFPASFCTPNLEACIRFIVTHMFTCFIWTLGATELCQSPQCIFITHTVQRTHFLKKITHESPNTQKKLFLGPCLHVTPITFLSCCGMSHHARPSQR
jgi:hypothetical protein